MTSAVAVFSGGLDSTTMVYDAIHRGLDIKRLVSFNYGQRHKKELDFAARTADKLNLNHSVIDLWSSGFTEALMTDQGGSALVDDRTEVPDGHYSEESMKATVVPNRNMVMIAIAGSIAIAENASTVLAGVHSGDHAIYPDCRPEFLAAASWTLEVGNLGFGALASKNAVTAPYIGDSKADIAYRAFELNVPLEDTWSCYKGDEIHCGRCGTCVERLEAIHEAQSALFRKGLAVPVDNTQYADTKFWKEAVNH
jgi:7-cyano-7-deazaguanine synthase